MASVFKEEKTMNIKIADKLIELRKKNGLSQEQLAEKLGLSRQAVSKWERAEASPDTDNLICLSKIYNISLDELLSTDESADEIAKETKEKEEEKMNQPESKKEEKKETKEEIVAGIIGSIALLILGVTYLILGFCMTDGWALYWPLFLFIPVIPSVYIAITKKKFCDICIPLLIAGIYCFIGTFTGKWHPFWFLFLIIPAYYLLVGRIDSLIKEHDL